MTKKLKYKVIFALLPILIGITFAGATPDEAPCALMIKSGKGSQLIPPQGKVIVHFTENMPVACGSMLITHEEPFWVKLSDATIIKVAPHTFFELPKTKVENYRIYRGAVLVTAPPSISKQIWATPNSESIFKGGVAWIQYDASDRKTIVASFNREIEFKNKFNEIARRTVHAGEMSSLAIQEAQVVPTEPAVMTHVSVVNAIEKLSLPESDKLELVAIVKRVYDDRAKSLASDMEEWEDAEVAPVKERAIASVTAKKSKISIDPKEASFVTKMMQERMYGSEEDQKMVDTERKPASASGPLVDSEQAKQYKNLKLNTKRIKKEIERLNENDE